MHVKVTLVVLSFVWMVINLFSLVLSHGVSDVLDQISQVSPFSVISEIQIEIQVSTAKSLKLLTGSKKISVLLKLPHQPPQQLQQQPRQQLPLQQLRRRLQQQPQRPQPVQQLLRQQPQRQLPQPFSQFGANGVSGKVAVNIVAKMVEFNFDSENVPKANAPGTVLIHNHVTFDHVPNGASGVTGVLVLPHVKLVPSLESVNVKTLLIILTAVVKVM